VMMAMHIEETAALPSAPLNSAGSVRDPMGTSPCAGPLKTFVAMLFEISLWANFVMMATKLMEMAAITNA
jgi:hypothetical protein